MRPFWTPKAQLLAYYALLIPPILRLFRNGIHFRARATDFLDELGAGLSNLLAHYLVRIVHRYNVDRLHWCCLEHVQALVFRCGDDMLNALWRRRCCYCWYLGP